MRVLVTGGEGFVGRHLLRHLGAEGHDLTATALAPSAVAERVEPGSTGAAAGADAVGGSGVRRRQLDVLDGPAVSELIAEVRPERVFHLAGFSSGAKAATEPARALRTNAEGTLNVLTAVAGAGLDTVVVVTGSADVYGDSGPAPVTEEAAIRPISAYGVSKAAQELVALGAGRVAGIDVRVARLFPLLGPGQGDGFVVPSFCRQALAIACKGSEPVLRVGNLGVERDFCDVRDGVRALALIAGLAEPSANVYNVCSGVGTPVRDLLDWILDEAGVDPEIVVDAARMRAGDPSRIVGSAGRLESETGWRPERDVREGVTSTYRWIRQTYLGDGESGIVEASERETGG